MQLPSISSKKGFTLIELLIVIAIIGILISIGLAAFRTAQAQARDGERKADIESIRGALEQYYADENVYPDKLLMLSPKYVRTVPTPPSGLFIYTPILSSGPTPTFQNYCLEVDMERPQPSGTPTCPTGLGSDLDYGLTARD